MRNNHIHRFHNAASATSNGNVLDINDYAAVAVQVTGTFTAVINFEGSVDGSNWVALQAIPSGSSTPVTSVSSAGVWVVPVSGFTQMRARLTWTSGTSVTVLGAPTAKVQSVISAGGTVNATLTASELHIGEVHGAVTVVSVTPTVTAGAYNATTKNSVGGKQTLAGAVRTSGGTAILQSVLVTDKGNQKAPLTILLFDSDPTGGTYTDNGQVNLSTDISKVIRRINVTAGDYETIDNSGTDYAIAEVGPISKLVKAASGTSLYAVILTTGTPTYVSTSDLTLRFGFLQ